MMVIGKCGKCGTIQDLSIKQTGKRKGDWCYWCPYCEDQIAPSAVTILEQKAERKR